MTAPLHGTFRPGYLLRMLPDHDDQTTPRLAVAGAFCEHFGVTHLYCLARSEMSVVVRHPQQAGPAPELAGTLLVWRQLDP